jgi:hypothetical protein
MAGRSLGDSIGMKMRAPQIEWPTEFDELGPAEDPSILLSAVARIDGVEYTVTAIRMREGMRLPDYRSDVRDRTYETFIDEKLDEIECLAETVEPALLSLGGGSYLLWMAPTGSGSSDQD